MGNTKIWISILVVAFLDMSMAACAKQKLLDDILSPSNAERALQILRLASVGANLINPTGNSLLDGVVPRFAPNVPTLVPNLPTIAPAKQLLNDFYQRRVLPRPVVNQPIVEVAPILPEIYPPVVAPTVIQEKVFPAVPIPQPCAPAVPVTYPPPPVPYPSAPVPLVNPFLPAASPVSALAPPTSSLLPPVVPTQVRSHFLRKIPIPPPSL